MKIIFMGSAAFAVPSLEALLQAGHDIALVVTQPDKPAGRGLKVHACPVAAFAGLKNLPLYQPQTLKDGTALNKLSLMKPDLIIVVSYGKILPNSILELPPLGSINVHASLLPKYRGAAPINWALANGDAVTGVTTMMISEKMDAGDILLQKETQIGQEETAIELHDRLAVIGAELMVETIDGIEKKKIKPRPQDESQATFAPILKKEDGLIDWKKSSREIFNLIRGMQPWPVAYTYLEGKVLRIFGSHIADETRPENPPIPPLTRGGVKPRWGHAPLRGKEGFITPGTVVAVDQHLTVATGDGTLYVTDVQLEGKKRMLADAFLRGHKIEIGTMLVSKSF